MRIASLLSVFALLASSAWAQHKDSHNYFQLGMGGVFSDAATGAPANNVQGSSDFGFDRGFSLSAAFGRSFRMSNRLSVDAELEAFRQYFRTDNGDLREGEMVDPGTNQVVEDNAKTLAFMLNGLVEWHFTPQFSFYGGGGFGWAKEIEYTSWDVGGFKNVKEDFPYAYQGRVGFAYNLGGTSDLLLGYRYFKTEPVAITDQAGNSLGEIDVAQHSIEAVFRWGL